MLLILEFEAFMKAERGHFIGPSEITLTPYHPVFVLIRRGSSPYSPT